MPNPDLSMEATEADIASELAALDAEGPADPDRLLEVRIVRDIAAKALEADRRSGHSTSRQRAKEPRDC